MPDKFSKEIRSKNMRAVKSKNTKPELTLRSALWNRGWRYNIHVKDITGKPDIVFRKYKLLIFVDGCFWHKCPRCFKLPKSNVEFWDEKLRKNVERDEKYNEILENEGYTILRFWEHEIKEETNSVVGKIELNIFNISKIQSEINYD